MGQMKSVFAAAVILAALSACDRGQPKLTECLGDVTAVPRIHDVAPPNCPSN